MSNQNRIHPCRRLRKLREAAEKAGSTYQRESSTAAVGELLALSEANPCERDFKDVQNWLIDNSAGLELGDDCDRESYWNAVEQFLLKRAKPRILWLAEWSARFLRGELAGEKLYWFRHSCRSLWLGLGSRWDTAIDWFIGSVEELRSPRQFDPFAGCKALYDYVKAEWMDYGANKSDACYQCDPDERTRDELRRALIGPMRTPEFALQRLRKAYPSFLDESRSTPYPPGVVHEEWGKIEDAISAIADDFEELRNACLNREYDTFVCNWEGQFAAGARIDKSYREAIKGVRRIANVIVERHSAEQIQAPAATQTAEPIGREAATAGRGRAPASITKTNGVSAKVAKALAYLLQHPEVGTKREVADATGCDPSLLSHNGTFCTAWNEHVRRQIGGFGRSRVNRGTEMDSYADTRTES
jgi:hypothetical protein